MQRETTHRSEKKRQKERAELSEGRAAFLPQHYYGINVESEAVKMSGVSPSSLAYTSAQPCRPSPSRLLFDLPSPYKGTKPHKRCVEGVTQKSLLQSYTQPSQQKKGPLTVPFISFEVRCLWREAYRRCRLRLPRESSMFSNLLNVTLVVASHFSVCSSFVVDS